jgi:rod shape determining protein RodA
MSLASAPAALGFADKLKRLNLGLILLLVAIAGIGVAALYSAGRGPEPWAVKHVTRFSAALLMMLVVALVDTRVWLNLAYPAYGLSLVLLLAVDIIGKTGMGAQRWLDLKVVQLQPSELMKIALILALARYYHFLRPEAVGRLTHILPSILMIITPVALVMVQPDLGTAMMVLLGGGALLFVAGVRLWKFALAVVLGIAALPLGWSLMHDYQRNRVLTFLDPDRDPLGTGYHITQSKIAIGSGGIFGRGWMEGTQSSLNFLPEKQTDFVFTLWTEETGLAGAALLIGLFALVLVYGYSIALRCRHHFGRLLAMGITITLFLYVFINTAMVMGLIPVVGVPLPLVSYGGTAMLSVLFACGLLLGVNVHRDVVIGRPG